VQSGAIRCDQVRSGANHRSSTCKPTASQSTASTCALEYCGVRASDSLDESLDEFLNSRAELGAGIMSERGGLPPEGGAELGAELGAEILSKRGGLPLPQLLPRLWGLLVGVFIGGSIGV
jgi:hypothetical protein